MADKRACDEVPILEGGLQFGVAGGNAHSSLGRSR